MKASRATAAKFARRFALSGTTTSLTDCEGVIDLAAWFTEHLGCYRGSINGSRSPDGKRLTLTFVPEVHGGSEFWLSTTSDGMSATLGFGLGAVVEEQRSSFESSEDYVERLRLYLTGVAEGSLVSYRIVNRTVRTTTAMLLGRDVVEIEGAEARAEQVPTLATFMPWERT